MKRLSVLPILAVCLCFGCSPTATTSSGTTGTTGDAPKVEKAPNPNLETVTSKDGSFTMSVPKDWALASSKEPKFVDALKKVGKESMMKSIEDIGAQPYFKLMVMDLKGIEAKKAFVNNLNVVEFPVSGANPGSDMKASADEAATQVFGTSPHKTSVIDTPNGKAGKYWGSTTIGSESKHDLIGGVLVHNGQALTISLSAADGEGKGYDALFDEIMSSIKFK
jgi:hypothetical protein